MHRCPVPRAVGVGTVLCATTSWTFRDDKSHSRPTALTECLWRARARYMHALELKPGNAVTLFLLGGLLDDEDID